jgi:chloramphenicol-sensitive protein RarD
MDGRSHDTDSLNKSGTLYGLGAYVLWGLFPLYWKYLSEVPSFQILAHRIVWSFILTLTLSMVLGKRKDIAALFRDRRRLLATVAAGVIVTANWGIFIWAVNSGRILETSLGYFLNPLVSVALGALVLKEKLDKGILAACGIALIGIAILTVSYGRLPWVALTLAMTFASYGLIKKMVNLDALMGLAMETMPIVLFAVAYLVSEQIAGRGSFGMVGTTKTVMLMLSGFITALPLFLYAQGVTRIPLSRMGFLQYISPTMQLLLGVLVFGEKLGGVRAISFAMIISALLVFALTRRKSA